MQLCPQSHQCDSRSVNDRWSSDPWNPRFNGFLQFSFLVLLLVLACFFYQTASCQTTLQLNIWNVEFTWTGWNVATKEKVALEELLMKWSSNVCFMHKTTTSHERSQFQWVINKGFLLLVMMILCSHHPFVFGLPRVFCNFPNGHTRVSGGGWCWCGYCNLLDMVQWATEERREVPS